MIILYVKSFNIVAIILNVLHNYFDDPIKLFLDLYLAKLLAKSFFPCRYKSLASIMEKI